MSGVNFESDTSLSLRDCHWQCQLEFELRCQELSSLTHGLKPVASPTIGTGDSGGGGDGSEPRDIYFGLRIDEALALDSEMEAEEVGVRLSLLLGFLLVQTTYSEERVFYLWVCLHGAGAVVLGSVCCRLG